MAREILQPVQRELKVKSQLLLAPNQLTLLRLVFIPFIVMNVMEGDWGWALGLFIAAGISDMLDGVLARALNQRSTLGQYLDPIADKLLLSTLFLVLSVRHQIAWKYTILVFSRDLCILVTCAVLYAASSLRDFRPSLFGKANTFAEICALFFVLLANVTSANWVGVFRQAFLWATFALTIISGVHYSFLTSQKLNAGSRAAR